VAKAALIERELKRDKLVAKYAAKHAEFKAIANDAKRSDDERAAARLGLQMIPRNANPHVNATVVQSPVAHAVLSASLDWAAPRCVKWRLLGIFPASPRLLGNRQEIQK